MKSKKELRKTILQKRDSLSPEQRHRKSQAITKRVIAHKSFQSAEKVLLFASYKSEVDTTELIRHALELGKQVYLPKVAYDENTQRDEMEFYRIFSEAELHEGYKGIREPEANTSTKFQGLQAGKEQIQAQQSAPGTHILIILPGAVFDRNGNRIGYGGGFYDRFLVRCEKSVYKMGIAFECQVMANDILETEPHDVRVDTVITEKKCCYIPIKSVK